MTASKNDKFLWQCRMIFEDISMWIQYRNAFSVAFFDLVTVLDVTISQSPISC